MQALPRRLHFLLQGGLRRSHLEGRAPLSTSRVLAAAAPLSNADAHTAALEEGSRCWSSNHQWARPVICAAWGLAASCRAFSGLTARAFGVFPLQEQPSEAAGWCLGRAPPQAGRGRSTQTTLLEGCPDEQS